MFRAGPLSANDAAALNRLAQQVAGLQNLGVSWPLSMTRAAGVPAITLDPTFLNDVVLVKATSTTPAGMSGVGAQCYEAVVLNPAPSDTTVAEGDTVWLTVLGIDAIAEAPELDRVYPCQVVGEVDADGTNSYPRAFAPAFSGSSGSILIDSGKVSAITPDIKVDTTANGTRLRRFAVDAGRWHVRGCVVARRWVDVDSGTVRGGVVDEAGVGVDGGAVVRRD